MKKFQNFSLVGVVFALALIAIPGCTSMQTGAQTLSAQKVDQIVKGKTTQAQIEQMFGPPDNMQLFPNGDRELMYYGLDINSDMTGHTVMQTLVPFGGLIPVNSTTTSRKRQLLVYLNSRSVVKNYAFSDATSVDKTTTSMFGAHTTEQTAQTPKSPAH